MLGLLLTIVSFVVSGRNAVEVSGEQPFQSDAVFTSTATSGTKGQMTEGNSVTLELSGWEGQTIERVTLQMKSNKSGGAGNLTMTVDNTPIWEIPTANFSHSSWYGAYTTELVEVTKEFEPAIKCEDGTISLIIEATQNSLYLSAVEIEYIQPAAKKATVNFVTNTPEQIASVTETEAGEGVDLPICVWSDGEWQFAGWTEKPTEETYVQPTCRPAGEHVYPKTDMTYYALYQKGENEVGRWQTTDWKTGKYAICMIGLAASGGVENHKLQAVDVDLKQQKKGEETLWYSAKDFSSNAIYNISFLTDSTASIMHAATEQYLWHDSQNKLTAKYGIWNIKTFDDHTILFYYSENGKYYALFLDAASKDDFFYRICEITISTAKGNGLMLFPMSPKKNASYSSYPMGMHQGWEEVKRNPQNEIIVPFGLYEIHIRDGKKVVLIK